MNTLPENCSVPRLSRLMVSSPRRFRQGGSEMLEFALVALLFTPLMVGTFVTGMNIIRSSQANYIARDYANMYIQGRDFSDYDTQLLANRLAKGLGMQIGTRPSGGDNQADNLNNSGNGIVWMSKIIYVASTSETPHSLCSAVQSPATCVNAGKFAFLQNIRFGNGTLETTDRASSLGACAATRNSSGTVTDDYVTDSDARVVDGGAMTSMWQVTNTNHAPLVDGQVIYVAEVYFQSPDLGVGALSGAGVYARWFF